MLYSYAADKSTNTIMNFFGCPQDIFFQNFQCFLYPLTLKSTYIKIYIHLHALEIAVLFQAS